MGPLIHIIPSPHDAWHISDTSILPDHHLNPFVRQWVGYHVFTLDPPSTGSMTHNRISNFPSDFHRKLVYRDCFFTGWSFQWEVCETSTATRTFPGNTHCCWVFQMPFWTNKIPLNPLLQGGAHTVNRYQCVMFFIFSLICSLALHVGTE